MSAHVLLNLLNELRKRDKMQGLQSILSLFPNKFDKFNNTGARMLDSIHHLTLIKIISGEKSCNFVICCYNVVTDVTSDLLILLHGVISLSDATPCDKLHSI